MDVVLSLASKKEMTNREKLHVEAAIKHGQQDE